jgi:RNA-directed DNA polymerase
MINTPKHLAYILKVPLEELHTITHNIDGYYYTKVEGKFNPDKTPRVDKTGKPLLRILLPSKGRLKIIQKRINEHILLNQGYFQIANYTYGAVRKRDNVLNAKRHQGKKFIFTTDLRNFFPSISHSSVFDLFRSNNFSPTVANLLTKLTTYKGQIPQGTPTAPMLANLVFNYKLGYKLDQISKRNNLTFTTFIDDLTFSSIQDFKQICPEILGCIRDSGFEISFLKTNYKTCNPIVTGVIVKNNFLDVTDQFKLKLIDAIDKSPEYLKGLLQYRNKIIKAK